MSAYWISKVIIFEKQFLRKLSIFKIINNYRKLKGSYCKIV